jgi:hypothetical protein
MNVTVDKEWLVKLEELTEQANFDLDKWNPMKQKVQFLPRSLYHLTAHLSLIKTILKDNHEN